VYEPAGGVLCSLPLLPEWYLGIAVLAVVGGLGVLWPPLFAALGAAVLSILISIGQALRAGWRASFTMPTRSACQRIRLRLVTASLHLVQPLARLRGRVAHGLTPWRRVGIGRLALPRPHVVTLWSERWHAPERWLGSVEAALRASRARTVCGGGFDPWDLEVRGGLLGAARLRMAVEEHGGGRQLVRFAVCPRVRPRTIVAVLLCGLVSLAAGLDDARSTAGVLAMLAVALGLRGLAECAGAMASVRHALTVTAPVSERRRSPAADRAPRQADVALDLMMPTEMQ